MNELNSAYMTQVWTGTNNSAHYLGGEGVNFRTTELISMLKYKSACKSIEFEEKKRKKRR